MAQDFRQVTCNCYNGKSNELSRIALETNLLLPFYLLLIKSIDLLINCILLRITEVKASMGNQPSFHRMYNSSSRHFSLPWANIRRERQRCGAS